MHEEEAQRGKISSAFNKEERCHVFVYTELDLTVAMLVIKPPRLFILTPTKERLKMLRLHLR